MTKDELITKLVQNENSAFTESDESDLSAMPEDFLKRLYLTTIDSTSITNARVKSDGVENATPKDEEPQVSELKSTLQALRVKAAVLKEEESEVLKLLTQYGITEKSVLNEYQEPAVEDIDIFVQNSKSPIADILREALGMREQQRQSMVNTIIANSGGLYASDELLKKSNDELQKLSAICSRHSALDTQTITDNPVFNWQGAGIADTQVANMGVDYGGDPLVLPSTWE